MAVMCQGLLVFKAIEAAYAIEFRSYFAAELARLEKLAEQGLVKLNENNIEVTATGWFFVRAVAMVFDRYLQTDRTTARFSKIL